MVWKKTIRWADFPRENPPMNVSVHLLMQHVATLPHWCRLRVQFVAFDTSNMLFSPTPPPHWNSLNVTYLYADCLFLSNRPEMMKQFSTELTSVGTFQRGVAHCDFHAYPLLPIKYSLSRSNYSLVFEAIIFCLLPWGWNRQITQSSFFFLSLFFCGVSFSILASNSGDK